MASNGATIKDIARESGYSIATVSRVLNNVNMYYNEETREKIEEVAKRLNYIPNLNARGLKGNKSRNLAFLVPHIDDFYVRILNVMQKIANKNDYSVLVLNSDYNKEQEQKHIKHILEMRYDGVIIASGFLNDIDIKKTFENIPIVFLEQHSYGDSFPTVAVNLKELCIKVIDHFVSKGHERIGFVKPPLPFKNHTDCFEGYKKGLEKHSIAFDENIVFEDERLLSSDSAVCKEVMQEILKKGNYTALFIISDLAAAVTVGLLNETGRRISIMCIDNLPFTQFTSPTLSTVDQNSTTLGEKGIEMMLDILSSKQVSNTFLDGSIILRQSTED